MKKIWCFTEQTRLLYTLLWHYYLLPVELMSQKLTKKYFYDNLYLH